jgi:hypothetical protein
LHGDDRHGNDEKRRKDRGEYAEIVRAEIAAHVYIQDEIEYVTQPGDYDQESFVEKAVLLFCGSRFR